MTSRKQLLREYIRFIIVEDSVELGAYGDSLSDVFLSPISDASKIIKGELSKITTRAQAAVRKISSGVLATLIPLYRGKIAEIKRQEDAKIREINSNPEYEKAWSIAKKFVTTGGARLAFMSNPVAFITSVIAVKSGKSALDLVGALLTSTDESSFVALGRSLSSKYTTSKLDLKKLMKQVAPLKEGLLGEADLKTNEVREFLKIPEVRRFLESAPLVKQLKSATREMAMESAKILIDAHKQIKSAQTLEELEGLVGKDIDLDALQDIGSEKVVAIELILDEIKLAADKQLIKAMDEHLKSLGLTSQEKHPYVQTMIKALSSALSSG